jgi:uncharacterized membrane protein YfcA
MTHRIFETLLHTVAGGTLAVLATARVEQIAAKFLRLAGIIALALLAGPVVWTFRRYGATWFGLLGAATAVAASVLILLAPFAQGNPKVHRTVCAFGGAAGLAAAAISAASALPSFSSPAAPVFAAFAQVLGGLLLGSITLAWLLGHAYLTATSMTIAPLQHFSRVLSWAVAGRMLFLAISLMFAYSVAGLPIGARLADAWLIAVLRIGVGLVLLAVLAYMVADCVRLRATQSATGILYFGSLMAYVGELAAQQLLRELAWPL